MATASILANALSALQSSQAALNTTSSNISNINTPGYKRRVVEFEAVQYGGTSGGVAISDIKRASASFLAAEALKVTANVSRYEAAAAIHNSLQSLFGSPDANTSLAGRLDKVFSTISDLSIDATSAIRRSTLLSDFSGLAKSFSNVATQIQKLRSDADSQVFAATGSINELLRQIDSLNPLIQREQATGGDANGLKDQRDQAVNRLAELMDIRVTEQWNGKLTVTTMDGVPLVTDHLYQLDYAPAGSVGASTSFGPILIKRLDQDTGQLVPPATNLGSHLNSGALQGLIDMRDRTLPQLADQVGQLAAEVIDAFNAVHNQNTAAPPPQSLTGRNTGLLGTDAHGFTGKTTFAVIDSTGALVTRADVDFTAGTYSVDGGAATAFGGTTVNAMVAAINAGLGANGTMTFSNGVLQLQATAAGNGVAMIEDGTSPSARGGHGFSQFFGLNDLFTANRPSHFDTGLAATDGHGFTAGQTIHLVLRGPNGEIAADYTHTVAAGTVGSLVTALNTAGTGLGGYVTFALDASGRLTATPTAAFAGFTLDVVDDQTQRGGTGTSFSQLFGIGRGVRAEQALGMDLASALKASASALGTAKVSLQPASVAGNVVLGVGDNTGVLALADVQNTVLSFAAAGDLAAMNGTLGSYAGTVLANISAKAARTDSLRDENQGLKDDVSQRIGEVEGVNLDEELANMLLYQQSYNAAARMITTANELFEQLLQAV